MTVWCESEISLAQRRVWFGYISSKSTFKLLIEACNTLVKPGAHASCSCANKRHLCFVCRRGKIKEWQSPFLNWRLHGKIAPSTWQATWLAKLAFAGNAETAVFKSRCNHGGHKGVPVMVYCENWNWWLNDEVNAFPPQGSDWAINLGNFGFGKADPAWRLPTYSKQNPSIELG